MNKNILPHSRAKLNKPHWRLGVSPTNKLTERNNALFLDYLNGTSFIDLVIKYRVSTQRITAIIKNVRAERIKELDAKKNGGSK